MAMPGEITNLQYTFTTDSLTFTWDAASDAEQYRATLYRDDVLVEEQVVTALTATFTGLEDGTEYLLAIRAENVQGSGPTDYELATTGFFVPATPTNFRELSTRIIAVEPAWDLAEPTKVLQVRIQLLIGAEILYDEVQTEAATSRLFPVPMASTDYLVRIQAGNPAGWSGWLEGTASTLVYPLIDTRLGVLGATYQEDVLHPDTWDGGTGAQGFGDPQVVEGGVELKFLDPRLMDIGEEIIFNASVTVPAITSRPVSYFYSDSEEIGLGAAVEIDDIESRPVSFFYDDKDDLGLNSTLSIPDITSVKALFVYNADESIGLSSTITVDPVTSELP